MYKKNIFILGSGRSGTSLVAGLFRNSGLFLGSEFYKPRFSNPLGFFEDREVNSINEEILTPFIPQRYNANGIAYGADLPTEGQRWLSRINTDTEIFATDEIKSRIKTLTSNQPFCFKDPRFAYTLDVWREVVSDNAKFICVFRNPSIVVSSILKEIRSVPYLIDFAMSTNQAFEVWRLMYLHILTKHSQSGEWLFLNYDDLFESGTLDRIEEFTEVTIDREFPVKELNRSRQEIEISEATLKIYAELLNCTKQ